MDKEDVVLEIEDITNCSFELWTLDSATSNNVKIKIPEKMWNEIVEKWKILRGKK